MHPSKIYFIKFKFILSFPLFSYLKIKWDVLPKFYLSIQLSTLVMLVFNLKRKNLRERLINLLEARNVELNTETGEKQTNCLHQLSEKITNVNYSIFTPIVVVNYLGQHERFKREFSNTINSLMKKEIVLKF